MKSFAFCTITYGDKYLQLGDTLIDQVTSLGYTIYVLTNEPNRYTNKKNVVVVPHKYPYFSFHQKRIIIRECLNNFDTAIFLDADVVMKNQVDCGVFGNVLSGLHIFATFGNISHTFLNDDITRSNSPTARNTKYGSVGKKLLDALGLTYVRDYHNIGTVDYLEHYLEGKWVISKDSGKEFKFLDMWDNWRLHVKKWI